MEKNAKIYVAGNTGMVGSAIVRKLQCEGYKNLVFTPWPEYDLRNQKQVNDFFEKEKPDYVFLAAAKVGGIHANNTYKAEFIYDNMMIEFNVIHAAYLNNVKKLLFLGSSCIYPKNCPQPIKEEYLLTGSLEPTNEPYAIAKISGLKMCDYYRAQYGCDFISAMPTNLYGPNDNYNLETSHVLPALIRKMHLAKCLESQDFDGIRADMEKRPFSDGDDDIRLMKNDVIMRLLEKYGIYLTGSGDTGTVKVKLWGTGKPYREFLHVDDLADALLFIMDNYSDYGHVNVGTGKDLTIKELAELVKDIVGFEGKIEWDAGMPDGTPRKLLDVTRIKNLGWLDAIGLNDGIHKVYKWFLTTKPVSYTHLTLPTKRIV